MCVNSLYQGNVPLTCELLNFNWHFSHSFLNIFVMLFLILIFVHMLAQFSSFVEAVQSNCPANLAYFCFVSHTFNLRMLSIFAIIDVVFYRIISLLHILLKLETFCFIYFILNFKARKINSSA